MEILRAYKNSEEHQGINYCRNHSITDSNDMPPDFLPDLLGTTIDVILQELRDENIGFGTVHPSLPYGLPCIIYTISIYWKMDLQRYIVSYLLRMVQGTYDIAISSITITEDHKKDMLFTDPYYAARQISVVQKNNTTVNNKDKWLVGAPA